MNHIFIMKQLNIKKNNITSKFKQSNNLNYKIFITSDRESVIKRAYKELDEIDKSRLFIIDGLYVHINQDGYKHADCKRYHKVILDFYLFRNCDYSVMGRS